MKFYCLINSEKPVKSYLLRHSRAGGNPERTEMTRSKSTLSPACAGMTEWRNIWFFTTPSLFIIKKILYHHLTKLTGTISRRLHRIHDCCTEPTLLKGVNAGN